VRYQGKITNWNDEKGYGFVEPNGGGIRAFVHIKSFSKRTRRPIEGDLIVYSAVKEKDGRFSAENIDFSRSQKGRDESKGNQRILGTIITLGFCIFILCAAVFGKLPTQLLVLYTVVSLLTFVVYAMDKSAAKSNNWRTKERALHLFGVIGGWPGAFFAQNAFRHKSKKAEFQTVFWVTVALNVGAVLYLFTEGGAKYLHYISNIG
jgi:uncharacterized membrane protein YsdA (DUF1294 family)/cold shock CspA family protein